MKTNARGSLLIASLAIMALLTVLVAGLAYSVAGQVHVYGRSKEGFEARMTFMNGYWAVAAAIYNDPISYIDHLNKDWYGSVKLPDFLKDNLQVIAGDEESKLNLNKIPSFWLETFLKEREDEGLSFEQIRKFKEALLDRRAKNPLVSTDELYLLKDADQALLREILPYVTVYTDTLQININTAPEPVLRSLIYSIQGDDSAQRTVLETILEKRPFYFPELAPIPMAEYMKLPQTPQNMQILKGTVPYITVSSCVYNMKMKFKNGRTAEVIAKESGIWSHLKILSWFET
ncbi:MAG: hypothetical protein V1882_02085 [Candidatus Omnitrophota bacterium]